MTRSQNIYFEVVLIYLWSNVSYISQYSLSASLGVTVAVYREVRLYSCPQGRILILPQSVLERNGKL